MEAKFTKGPWKAEYRTDPCVAMPGWLIKQDDNIKFPICLVPETQGGKKNKKGRSPSQEANALLIAAAPDLYEALDWALSEILCRTTYSDEDQRNNCLDKAQVALAKAEGRSA